MRRGYRWPTLLGTVMIPAFGLLALEPASFVALGSSGTIFLLIVMGLMGLLNGIVSPAANNACIELMPHRVATIAAMRSMFRQSGQVFNITTGSLTQHDFGITRGFQIFFLGLAAVVLFIMMPTIFAVPRSPSEVPKTRTSAPTVMAFHKAYLISEVLVIAAIIPTLFLFRKPTKDIDVTYLLYS